MAINVKAYEAFFSLPDLEGSIESQSFLITPNFWPAQVFLARSTSIDKFLFICDNTEGLQIEIYKAQVTGTGNQQVFTPDILLATVSHPEGDPSPFQEFDLGSQDSSGGTWRKWKLNSPLTLINGAYYIIVFKTTLTTKSPKIFWTLNYRQSIFPIITASINAGFDWSNDNIETHTAGNMQSGAICFGYIGNQIDALVSLDSGSVTIGGLVSSRRGYPVFIFVENEDALSTTVSINFSQIPPVDPINGTSEETDQSMMRWYYFEEGTLPVSGDLEPILFKTNAQPVLGIASDFVVFIQPDRLSPLADVYLPEGNINLYADPIGIVPIYESTPKFINFNDPATDENVLPEKSSDNSDRFSTDFWAHLRNKSFRVETSGKRSSSSSQNPSYFDFSTENPNKDIQLIKTITIGGTLAGPENEEDVVRGFNKTIFYKEKYIAFSKKLSNGLTAVPIVSYPGQLTAYVSDENLSNWERKEITLLDSSPSTLGITGGTEKTYLIGIHDILVTGIQGVETIFFLFGTYVTLGGSPLSYPSFFNIGYYQGDLTGNIDVQLIGHETVFSSSPFDFIFANTTDTLDTLSVPLGDPDDKTLARFITPNNGDSIYFTASGSTIFENISYGLGLWKIGLNDILSDTYVAEVITANNSGTSSGISDPEFDSRITFVFYDGNTTYLGVRGPQYVSTGLSFDKFGFARVYRTDDFQTFEQLLGGDIDFSDPSSDIPSWLVGFNTKSDFALNGGVFPGVAVVNNDVKFIHKVGNILHVWVCPHFYSNNNTPMHIAINTITKDIKVLRKFPIEDDGDSSYSQIPKISDLEVFKNSKNLRWIEGGSVNGNQIYIHGAENLLSATEPISISTDPGIITVVHSKPTQYRTRWIVYDDRTINQSYFQYNNPSYFIRSTDNSNLVSSIEFDGTGNNDLTVSGNYTRNDSGAFSERYLIEVQNEALDSSFIIGTGIGTGTAGNDLIPSGSPTVSIQETFVIEIDRIAEIGTGTVSTIGSSTDDPAAGFDGLGLNDVSFTGTPTSVSAIGIKITKESADPIFTGFGMNPGPDDLNALIVGPLPGIQNNFKVQIDNEGLNPSFNGSPDALNLIVQSDPTPQINEQHDYTITIVEEAGTVSFVGSGVNDLFDVEVVDPDESYIYQISIDKLAGGTEFTSAPIFSVANDDLEFFGDVVAGYFYEVEIDNKGMEVLSYAYLDDFEVTRQVVFNGMGVDDFEIVESLSQDGIEYSYDALIEIDSIGTPDTYKISTNGGATFTSLVSIVVGPFNVASSGWRGQFGSTTGHTVGDRWSFQTRANASAFYKVEIDSIGLDPSPNTLNTGMDDLSASTDITGPLGQFFYKVEITEASGRNVLASPEISDIDDNIFVSDSDATIKALGNIPDDRTFPETDPAYDSNAVSFRVEIDGKALDAIAYGTFFYSLEKTASSIFNIYDSSDLNTILTLSSTLTGLNNAFDFVIRDNYAYIASTELKIYDISDKTSPVLISTFDLSIYDGSGLSVSDDHLYMSANSVSTESSSSNLVSIDISDPQNPTIESVARARGIPSAIFVSKPSSTKTMAYIASSSENRISFFQIKDTSSGSFFNDDDFPLNIGLSDNVADTETGQIHLYAQGERLYVACSSSNKIVIYNGLSSFRARKTYVGAGTFRPGEMVIGAANSSTAIVIKDIGNAIIVGNISTDIGYLGVSLDGNSFPNFSIVSVITGSESGIARTSSPLEYISKDMNGAEQLSRDGFKKAIAIDTYGTSPTFVHAFDLDINGSLRNFIAVVISGNNTVEIYETTILTTPTLVSIIPASDLLGSPSNISSRGNILFVTCVAGGSGSGIFAFEISEASIENIGNGGHLVAKKLDSLSVGSGEIGKFAVSPIVVNDSLNIIGRVGPVSFSPAGAGGGNNTLQAISFDGSLEITTSATSLTIGTIIIGQTSSATAIVISASGSTINFGNLNGRFILGESIQTSDGLKTIDTDLNDISINTDLLESGKYIIRVGDTALQYKFSIDGGSVFSSALSIPSATANFIEIGTTNVFIHFASIAQHDLNDSWEFDVGPNGAFNYKVEIDRLWKDTLISTGVFGLNDLSLFGDPTRNVAYQIIIDGIADQFGYGYGYGAGGDFFDIFGFDGSDIGYGDGQYGFSEGSFESNYAFSYNYGIGYEYGGYPSETFLDETDTFTYKINGITTATKVPITGELQDIGNGIFAKFESRGQFTEDYLFTLSVLNKFQILKIDSIFSDPLNSVVETKSFDFGFSASAISSASACTENFMFIAVIGVDAAIYIYKTKDPEKTHLVGIEFLLDLENVVDMIVSGNYLFIIVNSSPFNIFRIYDISYANIGELVELDSSFILPAFELESIRINGNYAFIAENNGLNIILRSYDVTNPSSIIAIGSGLTLSLTDTNSISSTIQGDYCYIAGGDGVDQIIESVDISSPASLTLESTTITTINSEIEALDSTETFLFASGRRSSPVAQRVIQVFDIISNPGTPIYLGEYVDNIDSSSSFMLDIKVKNGLVYAISYNSGNSSSNLYVIDFSQPTNPVLLTSIPLENSTSILNLCTLTSTQGHTYGDTWTFSTADTIRWTDTANRPITIWNEQNVELTGGFQNIDNLTAIISQNDSNTPRTGGYALGDVWDFNTVDSFRWVADLSGANIDISNTLFTWEQEKVLIPFEGGIVDLESGSPFDNLNVKLDFFDSDGYLVGNFIEWSFTKEDVFTVTIRAFDPLNPIGGTLYSTLAAQTVIEATPVNVGISTPVATGNIFITFVNKAGHADNDSWTFTTVDTFRWTDKAKAQLVDNDILILFSLTWNATKVAITDDVLDLYALNNNVDIKFSNKNNHTLGDNWLFPTVDTFKYSVGNSLETLTEIRDNVVIPLNGGVSSIGKSDFANIINTTDDVFIDIDNDLGHNVGDKWRLVTTDSFSLFIFSFGYGYGYGGGADFFDVFGMEGGFYGYGYGSFELDYPFNYGYGFGYEYGYGQYGSSPIDIEINLIPIKFSGEAGEGTDIGNGIILHFTNSTGHTGNEIWQFSSADKFQYQIDLNPVVGPILVNDDFIGVEHAIELKFNSLAGFVIGNEWTFKTLDTFKWYLNSVLQASEITVSMSNISLTSYMAINFGSLSGHPVGTYWEFSVFDEFVAIIVSLLSQQTLESILDQITGTAIAITGSPQLLGGSGISVTFGTQIGHTIGDIWRIATVDSYEWNNGSSNILELTTLAPNLLDIGISVSFTNTINHKIGDHWEFDIFDEIGWSIDNGDTFEASNISASTSPILLNIESGLSFFFGDEVGHDLGDTWRFHPVPKVGYQLIEGKGVYHGKTIAKFSHDELDDMFADYPGLAPDIIEPNLQNNPRVGIYCGMVSGATSSTRNIEDDDDNLEPELISINGISYIVSDNMDNGIRAYKTYGVKEFPENWGRSLRLDDNSASTIADFEKADLDKSNYNLAIGGPDTFLNIARTVSTSKSNNVLFITEVKANDITGFENVDPLFPNRAILAIVNGLHKPQLVSMFYQLNYIGSLPNVDLDLLADIENSDMVLTIKGAQTLEKLFTEPAFKINIPLAQIVDGDDSTKSLIRHLFSTDEESNFFRIESSDILSTDATPITTEKVDLRIKALKLGDISLTGPEEATSNKKVSITGIVEEGTGIPENIIENGVIIPPDGEIIVDFAQPIYISELTFDVEYFGFDLSGANQSQFEIYVLSKFQKETFGENIVDESDWILLGSPVQVGLIANQDQITKDAIGMYIKAFRIVLKANVSLKVKNLSVKSFIGTSNEFVTVGDISSPEMIIVDDAIGILTTSVLDRASSFATINSNNSSIELDLGENVPVTRISMNTFSGGSPTRTLTVEIWDGVTIDDSSNPEFENVYTNTVRDYEYSIINWNPRLKDKSREVRINFLENDDIGEDFGISEELKQFNKPSNFNLLANSGLTGFSFRPNIFKDASLTVTSSKATVGEEFQGSIFVNCQMDEDGPFAADIGNDILGIIEKSLNIDFAMRQIRKVRITLSNQSGSDNDVRINGFKLFSPIVNENGNAEFPRSGVIWTIRLTASVLSS